VTGRSTSGADSRWSGTIGETAAAVTDAGGRGISAQCNHRDDDQVAALFRRIDSEHGRLDLLVNNAAAFGDTPDGYPKEIPFWELSTADWDEMMAVNLRSIFLCTRAVLPGMMEKRSGKIIALVCDQTPKLNFSAYSTSKTAVVRFVETLAAEVADHNIQINSFDPGPTNTNVTDEIIGAESRLEPKVVIAAKETRRTGGVSPELQLEHAMFLASERSNHITGKLIEVTDDWKKLKNARLREDAFTLRRVQR